MKGRMKKRDVLLAAKPKKRNKGGESGNPSKVENSLCPTTERNLLGQAFRAGYRSQKH